jgi:hypothetical protein
MRARLRRLWTIRATRCTPSRVQALAEEFDLPYVRDNLPRVLTRT